MNIESIRKDENTACCYRQINNNGVRVIWEVTGRCNLRCVHCFANISNDLENKNELTTEEAFNIIDKFNLINVGKVMITGGEPLMRKDFIKIINRIRKCNKDIVIDITTNGLLLNNNLINELLLSSVDELSISLDGPEIVYKRIRGENSDFKKLIGNIKQLINNKIKVDGIMVLSKLNLDYIEETIHIAYELGMSSLSISNLLVLDNSNYDYQSLKLSNEEVDNAIKLIKKLQQVYKDKLVIRTVGFVQCKGEQTCTNKNIIAINRNGMFLHCLTSYKLGDLIINSRQHTLDEAFNMLSN